MTPQAITNGADFAHRDRAFRDAASMPIATRPLQGRCSVCFPVANDRAMALCRKRSVSWLNVLQVFEKTWVRRFPPEGGARVSAGRRLVDREDGA